MYREINEEEWMQKEFPELTEELLENGFLDRVLAMLELFNTK
jgi:hypothetical protein